MMESSRISWQWAVGLCAAFPILLLLANEGMHRAIRAGSVLAPALRTCRNLLIPAAGVAGLLVLVLQVPQTDPFVRVVLTVLWIIVLYAGLQLVNDVMFDVRDVTSRRANIPRLFRDIARFAVVGVGAAIIYSRIWGQEIEGALTALGVGSLVIGLALQEPLGNIFSGLMLLAERPVGQGEWISVDGKTGRVVEMNWRAVKMETLTLETIVVPNSALYRTSFANLSRPTPQRTFTVELVFGRDIPPNLVKQTLRAVARETPGVLTDPPPEVRTARHDTFQIAYEVFVTVATQEEIEHARDEFLSRAWYASRRHGLVNTLQTALTPRDVLSRFPLFQSIADLPDLFMRQETFTVGESLLRPGAEQDGLCLMLSGLAVLRAPDARGGMIEVGMLGPGDYFGEHSVLVGSVSTTSLVALSDCEVAHFDLESSRRLVECSPGVARDLGATIDRRRTAVSAAQRPAR